MENTTDLQEYERGYEQGKLDGKADIISLIMGMTNNNEILLLDGAKIINKIRQ